MRELVRQYSLGGYVICLNMAENHGKCKPRIVRKGIEKFRAFARLDVPRLGLRAHCNRTSAWQAAPRLGKEWGRKCHVTRTSRSVWSAVYSTALSPRPGARPATPERGCGGGAAAATI